MLNRYFRCTTGRSNKFWRVSVHGKSYTVWWGRIGTEGQSKAKTLSSTGAALAEASRKCEEKLSKGYVEVNENGSLIDAGQIVTALAYDPASRRSEPIAVYIHPERGDVGFRTRAAREADDLRRAAARLDARRRATKKPKKKRETHAPPKRAITFDD